MKMINSKIKEDDKILKRFNRLGKSELYLDMLFFLRFGSARLNGLLDSHSNLFCSISFYLKTTSYP